MTKITSSTSSVLHRLAGETPQLLDVSPLPMLLPDLFHHLPEARVRVFSTPRGSAPAAHVAQASDLLEDVKVEERPPALASPG